MKVITETSDLFANLFLQIIRDSRAAIDSHFRKNCCVNLYKKSLWTYVHVAALIEGAQRSFQEWIAEDIQNISVSKIFQMAPFLRHSIADVIFFYAWLTKFSSGKLNSFVREKRL
jgi:hypothetical protein